LETFPPDLLMAAPSGIVLLHVFVMASAESPMVSYCNVKVYLKLEL